jgi:hypothetical protein
MTIPTVIDCRFDSYDGETGTVYPRAANDFSNCWLLQCPNSTGVSVLGTAQPYGTGPIALTTSGTSTPMSLVTDPAGSGKQVAKIVIHQDQPLLEGDFLRSEYTQHSVSNNQNGVVTPARIGNGTGTNVTATGTTAVVGTSTSFTTEIGPVGTRGAGKILYSATGTVLGTVVSVASNTALTLAANATFNLNSVGGTENPTPAFRYSSNTLLGTGGMGVPAASSAVTGTTTLFTTETASNDATGGLGDYLYVDGGTLATSTYIGQVKTINSNTSITLTSGSPILVAGNTAFRICKNQSHLVTQDINGTTSRIWYWYSFYMPSDWNPGCPMVLMQMHQTTLEAGPVNETPNSLDPPFVLTTDQNYNWAFSPRINKLTFSQAATRTTSSDGINRDGQNPSQLIDIERYPTHTISPLPLGRWVELVMSVTCANTDAVGKMDIWIDRRKVFTSSRRNTFSKTYGYSIHNGLYAYGKPKANSATNTLLNPTTLYVKGSVISSTNHANFNAFMTELGWATKTELEQTFGGNAGL